MFSPSVTSAVGLDLTLFPPRYAATGRQSHAALTFSSGCQIHHLGYYRGENHQTPGGLPSEVSKRVQYGPQNEESQLGGLIAAIALLRSLVTLRPDPRRQAGLRWPKSI